MFKRILSGNTIAPKQEKSITPHGKLEQFVAQGRDQLKSIATLDLLHELGSRLARGDEFPSSEEALAISKQIQDHLRAVTNVHFNRFSAMRLFDYYNMFLTPKGKAERPPIQGKTWVEIGCGSMNPFAFLFLILMLGGRRGIAIDLEPIKDISIALKALADLAAIMILDPKAIAPYEDISRNQILENISTFDLALLMRGDEAGMDRSRLDYLQEPVESLSLKDGFADVLMSNSFLEHVADLGQIVDEFARITAPGGIGVHGVDATDHRRYSAPETHPLSFLDVEDNRPLVLECNRVRPVHLPKIFEDHGFEILEHEIWERTTVTPEMRDHFVDPYRSMSLEDLEIVRSLLIVRRK